MSDKKRRVLLKLSGEAFGDGQLGINPDVVAQIAREIAEGAKKAEVAIVVGGGNFFRGAELSQRGMDRRRADYMGMLGTVMNALALQDFLEQAGRRSSGAICYFHDPGRGALYSPARYPPHGKGSDCCVRSRSGLALLLHRHGRCATGARSACG